MAQPGPRIRNVTATATVAGGAGAATATIAVPTGYKLRSLTYNKGTIAAAGTITVKDNNGAGSTLLTVTVGTTRDSDIVSRDLFTCTTPLQVAVASGGANGNACEVKATFYRTRAHA